MGLNCQVEIGKSGLTKNTQPTRSTRKNVEPLWWKANPKGSAPQSGHATVIMVFFAHLLILEDLYHHQNLISSSLYYPGLPLLPIKFHPNLS